MKKYILLMMLIMSIFSINVASVSASAEVYKSATEYDYPPFSVTEDGKADGFSVELLKAVADVMDLDISFKVDSWATIKEELKDGELDVLPLVGYTEERDEYFDFTVPYIVMHGNIFIRTDEKDISTTEDLYGKDIIVMKGDNAHEYAERMGFSDHLITVDTYPEAFRLLSSGKYDAVLAQSLVGEQLIKQLNIKNVRAATRINEDDLTEIRTNLEGFEQKFCFAVHDGDKELLAKLNEGLAIVNANGEFNTLYRKWFPFMVDDSVDPVKVLETSLYILVPVLILVILIGSFVIRRKIKQKKEELERYNRTILDMEAQLRQQQKLESIGILAGGVAHEINNPINGVLNYGQIISDIARNDDGEYEGQREQVLEYSNEIINESNRIASIVSNLLHFSSNGRNLSKEFDPNGLINGILSLVKSVIQSDQIEIRLDLKKGLPLIDGDEGELQQVLLNLIVNARDALNSKYGRYDDDKIISITTGETILPGEVKGIRITVEDHGNGIPDDIKGRIFDPFFTTKGRTEGTGLGLYISYNIIKDHGGTISFETREGKYTKVHIDLPVHHDESE